jgi:hypothetical protein
MWGTMDPRDTARGIPPWPLSLAKRDPLTKGIPRKSSEQAIVRRWSAGWSYGDSTAHLVSTMPCGAKCGALPSRHGKTRACSRPWRRER